MSCTGRRKAECAERAAMCPAAIKCVSIMHEALEPRGTLGRNPPSCPSEKKGRGCPRRGCSGERWQERMARVRTGDDGSAPRTERSLCLGCFCAPPGALARKPHPPPSSRSSPGIHPQATAREESRDAVARFPSNGGSATRRPVEPLGAAPLEAAGLTLARFLLRVFTA